VNSNHKNTDTNAILITGSNGGIGGMILSYLLKNGHRNIICQYRRSSDQIKKIFEIYAVDPTNRIFQADLNDEVSVQNKGIEIRKKHAFVSTIINVAGSSKNGMSWKITKNDFISVIHDNVLSAFLCSKEFIPDMREKNFGRIINFSSIVGHTGIAGASSYCAAKAALMGLTKSMSKELASKKITVNAIALGYFNAGLINEVSDDIKTEIKKNIPMQRFGDENDIGSLIQYLIGQESNYITGQIINLNGGQI